MKSRTFCGAAAFVPLLIGNTLCAQTNPSVPAPETASSSVKPAASIPSPLSNGHASSSLARTPPVSRGTAGPPLLLAQCTRARNGAYKFDMFATFGDPADLGFYPPWKPKSDQDLFPPHTQKVILTMTFLGYTHVKPLRREWEIPAETPAVYHFNPPGRGSPNLEPIAFDLRYMLALPTFQLSIKGTRTAEFATTPLLAAIRTEPLCHAAEL